MALRLTSLPPNYNISIARTAESARYSLAEPPLAQRITDSAYDQNPFARRTQHKNLHVNLCHYSVLAPQCTSTGPLQTLCQDCDAHRVPVAPLRAAGSNAFILKQTRISAAGPGSRMPSVTRGPMPRRLSGQQRKHRGGTSCPRRAPYLRPRGPSIPR
jgi:hypothetical protein